MKVVEAEVAKRLAAERRKDEEERREKEEEERRTKEKEEAEMKAREQDEKVQVHGSPTKGNTSLPSGVLTPLLKKHKDLDDELRTRLRDLERKLDQGQKETSLAGVLSPVSKKKTGRAYVSLARAYSEKGKLGDALELYRRAEAYVPDNVKLKERIIEIEWAVKNNQEFVPSPKPPRKEKKKRGRKAGRRNRKTENPTAGLGGNVDENGNGIVIQVNAGGMKANSRQGHDQKLGSLSATEFGLEITNTASIGNLTNPSSASSPRLFKRLFVDVEEGDRDLGDGGDRAKTPVKKPKLTNPESDNDEMASEDEVEVEVWRELPSAQMKEKAVVAS